MLKFRRNRSTKRRRLPRTVVAAAHWVLAFAIVFGIVHSGGRYFYCEAFGLLPFDPCVDASTACHHYRPLGMLCERPDAVDLAGLPHTDCCEIVTLAAMPQAAPSGGPAVAPAARLAVLPALWLADRTNRKAHSQIERAFKRWRPPPRASTDLRAELMVFLV